MTLKRIQPAIIIVRDHASSALLNRNPKPAVFRPHPGILGLLILCLAVCLPARAGSQGVILEWNGASGTNVAGYYLHYGTASQDYTFHIDAGTNTMIAVSGIASGPTYYFAVTAYDVNGNESLPSNEASFIVSSNVPPVITSQPVGSTNLAGSTASFAVSATGGGLVSYQWLKNTAPIPGATLATLALAYVSDANAASYSAVVSNAAGTAVSSAATLTVIDPPVIDPPVIVNQPVNATNVAGTTAAFSVSVSGATPLSYQWWKNTAPLGGATAATLTLASVSDADAASYTLVVSNRAGIAVSSIATLTVLDPPVITSQLASRTNVAGTTAAFSVSISGAAPLSYQWWKNTTPLGGATAATLTLASVSDADAASYTLVVSNRAGIAISSIATLTVLDPPVITGQPASRTNVAGTTAAFSVSVSGAAPLSYQWWKNTAPLGGATAATLTLASVSDADAASYTLVVSNRTGIAISSIATLTVLDPPIITSRLASRTNVAGTTAVFSVSVSGAVPLSYQWWKNTAPLGGATAATLTLASVSDADAASYTLVVSNRAGIAISSIATLTVLDPPVLLAPLLSQTDAAGSIATFAVLAGGTPPLAWQWLKNATPIFGATNSTLALTNISTITAGSYAVMVSNSAGSVTSGPATLTVTGVPSPMSLSQQAGTGGSISKTMVPRESATPASIAAALKRAASFPTPQHPAVVVSSELRLIPGLKTGDPITVKFSVAPAHSYELQTTTDLQSWTTLETTGVAAENSWVEFEDAQSRNCFARFYRVVCH